MLPENPMDDSINQFENIFHSRQFHPVLTMISYPPSGWLQRCDMFLLLNKRDLFVEKIKRVCTLRPICSALICVPGAVFAQ